MSHHQPPIAAQPPADRCCCCVQRAQRGGCCRALHLECCVPCISRLFLLQQRAVHQQIVSAATTLCFRCVTPAGEPCDEVAHWPSGEDAAGGLSLGGQVQNRGGLLCSRRYALSGGCASACHHQYPKRVLSPPGLCSNEEWDKEPSPPFPGLHSVCTGKVRKNTRGVTNEFADPPPPLNR